MTDGPLGQDFLEEAFAFWFDQPRGLFPTRLRAELTRETERTFLRWYARPENGNHTSEVYSDKFTSILFALAGRFCNEDERLTLRYPHLPQLGERVNLSDPNGRAIVGKVAGRELVQGRRRFLIVGPRRLSLRVVVELDVGGTFVTSFAV